MQVAEVESKKNEGELSKKEVIFYFLDSGLGHLQTTRYSRHTSTSGCPWSVSPHALYWGTRSGYMERARRVQKAGVSFKESKV